MPYSSPARGWVKLVPAAASHCASTSSHTPSGLMAPLTTDATLEGFVCCCSTWKDRTRPNLGWLPRDSLVNLKFLSGGWCCSSLCWALVKAGPSSSCPTNTELGNSLARTNSSAPSPQCTSATSTPRTSASVKFGMSLSLDTKYRSTQGQPSEKVLLTRPSSSWACVNPVPVRKRWDSMSMLLKKEGRTPKEGPSNCSTSFWCTSMLYRTTVLSVFSALSACSAWSALLSSLSSSAAVTL
mmetsp:Transcript_2232/g.4118  ORF Transcript_2232/g.4118 Transcript_2232/m.4118 type:complete len:240 (-) Transcript_2232:766-1485(-)